MPFIDISRRAIIAIPYVCLGLVAAAGCASQGETGSDVGRDAGGQGTEGDATVPVGEQKGDASAPGADGAADVTAPPQDAARADAARDGAADAARDATAVDGATDAAPDGPRDAATDGARDAADAGVPDADGGAPDSSPPDASDAGVTTDASLDGSVVPSDALGIWYFDENTGTTSVDSSGHQHPATLMGNATWAPGKSGSGLALDGATAFADLGAPLLDTSRSFSVSCWIAFAALPGWQTAISQDGNQLSVFTLKRRDDNAKIDFDFPGQDSNAPTIWSVAQSTTEPTVGTFMHLAATYDVTAQTLAIFVNGALEDSQPATAMLPGAGHTVIGRGKWLGVSSNFINGVIDDVRLFQRSLAPGEVRAIYETTK